jgi:catechol 2,3-dioxygenase-like lactoylglutathione lyase family enzyme
MAIVGAHVLLYTSEAERLRETLRDVLGWDSVDSHDPPDGWLIFKLPPAELGVHPSEGATTHQICFMCDDLERTMAELGEKGIEFRGEPEEESFGLTITMLLAGGVEVLLYEPRHASPLEAFRP